METGVALNSVLLQVISIIFFNKKRFSPLFSKHHVCQGEPRNKSQSLPSLLSRLLKTAGSVSASVEVQIFKAIEWIILENGWQKFTHICARALSRQCRFGNTASVHYLDSRLQLRPSGSCESGAGGALLQCCFLL